MRHQAAAAGVDAAALLLQRRPVAVAHRGVRELLDERQRVEEVEVGEGAGSRQHFRHGDDVIPALPVVQACRLIRDSDARCNHGVAGS